MIALRLAYRNLVGAGLRTWLNVVVLSMAFVVIIWQRGLLEGWNRQARTDTIQWEIGGGQYWHPHYDPYDPFTLAESHAAVPKVLPVECAPILIAQATIYPEGRMQSILLKGIDPDQRVLAIPTALLDTDSEAVPAVIGTRVAKHSRLKQGDRFTVQWRDAKGAFDAAEVRIVGVFKSNVPAVDNRQLWIPLQRLREMMVMPDEATLVVVRDEARHSGGVPGWFFRDQGYLLADVDRLIRQKSIGQSIFYVVLLMLAMLAIFDTQVLSVFRRQKEIGTHIALGMTRGQVVRLFTLEGAMHGLLAAVAAAVYGIPLLWLQATRGFTMPEATDDLGVAIAEKIFPVYSLGLVLGTVCIVLTATTVVSFLPSRRIAKMNPTDALRGKIP